MTTREFIQKTYNTTNNKWGRHGYDRWCSSVKTDSHGVVYSYGSHYPLAFNVMGMDFVNNAGYSNTTSKHIGWAQAAIGYGKYINVKLWRDDASVIASSYATPEQKIKVIKAALTRELTELTVEMASKKRKDTQVYKHLAYQQAQLIDAAARVVAGARA